MGSNSAKRTPCGPRTTPSTSATIQGQAPLVACLVSVHPCARGKYNVIAPWVCGHGGEGIFHTAALKDVVAQSSQLLDDVHVQPQALALCRWVGNSMILAAEQLVMVSLVLGLRDGSFEQPASHWDHHTCVQMTPPGFRARCMASKKGCTAAPSSADSCGAGHFLMVLKSEGEGCCAHAIPARLVHAILGRQCSRSCRLWKARAAG